MIAYTLNRLGTWFGLVALLVAVFDHTHDALAVSGLLLAGQALPAFAVPLVVARVEASARRRELSGLYFIEAAATAVLAFLMSHFSLPAVLLFAALDGTAALTASSLLRAEVAHTARRHVELEARETVDQSVLEQRIEEAQRTANAALNVAFTSTFVLGPVLAGAVVAAAGASAALLIDVGSFVLCGLLLLDLHPHVEEAGGDSMRERLSVAWRHIVETPSLRVLLLVEATALLFFESAGPIEVPYAKATLHVGDRGFGLLLTAWGAGGVLGSVVFARLLKRPLSWMISAGALAIGLAYVGFAAAPSLAPACGAAFVGGIGNGLQWPSLISAVQRATPPALQGRLMGAVESLAALCLALGLILGGLLVTVSSSRIAFVVVGSGAIVAAIVLRITPAGDTPSGGPGEDRAHAPRLIGAAEADRPAQRGDPMLDPRRLATDDGGPRLDSDAATHR